MSASLTVIILTFNEEAHVERAIRSIKPATSEIVVVDSFSSDRTLEIARSLGARVYQHTFANQADQFQWALDNVALNSDWIMRLDADEYPTPELNVEIIEKLARLDSQITGVILNRRHIFLGRFIKHGGRYPLPLLRIWRAGAARVEQRLMDEHIVLLYGRTVTFRYDFCDHNLKSITHFTEKHNAYATREAVEVINHRFSLLSRDTILMRAKQGSATAKRYLKERFYIRLPLSIGPLAYFVYRYFIQLGLLDGQEGLAYHFLQGFWYRMLVATKVLEFERALAKSKSNEDRICLLEQLSGLKLHRAQCGESEGGKNENSHLAPML